MRRGDLKIVKPVSVVSPVVESVSRAVERVGCCAGRTGGSCAVGPDRAGGDWRTITVQAVHRPVNLVARAMTAGVHIPESVVGAVPQFRHSVGDRQPPSETFFDTN